MSVTLRLENQLCHRFYLLSNAFTRAYRPLLEELDITYPQYVVMMALWEKDDITVATLLDKTGIDGGAMSLMLKKLVQKDYVEIHKDEKDARVKVIKLTTKGNNAKQVAIDIPAQMMCKLDGFSEDEAKQLRDLMDKLQICFD